MSLNVPFWGQLPDYAQNELSTANYSQGWFDKQSDAIRLTVLNLYVKLRGLNLYVKLRNMKNLWNYVKSRNVTPVGSIEFFAHNVVKLKQELTNRPEFTLPQDSLVSWECREKRTTCALHFKHFTGWPQDKVQVHIDKIGLGFGGRWSPPVIGTLIMGPAHIADYCNKGWQDVFGIRNTLLQQGWDRQPLLGISTWHCGARDCPTHKKPEHRCQAGVWYCGRRQPPCPGHINPNHRCSTGSVWICGNRNCPSHSGPDHICNTGVWYCGRKKPLCPGHRNRHHQCEHGAALLYTN